jgi:hypothetical protein
VHQEKLVLVKSVIKLNYDFNVGYKTPIFIDRCVKKGKTMLGKTSIVFWKFRNKLKYVVGWLVFDSIQPLIKAESNLVIGIVAKSFGFYFLKFKKSFYWKIKRFLKFNYWPFFFWGFFNNFAFYQKAKLLKNVAFFPLSFISFYDFSGQLLLGQFKLPKRFELILNFDSNLFLDKRVNFQTLKIGGRSIIG